MNMKALTKEQSDFATAHHGLVTSFLKKQGLPFEEFYDTVIFGYLNAVREFFEKEGLSEKYSFTAVAYRQMRFRAMDAIRAKNAAKRKANVLPYDEDIFCDTRVAAPDEPERTLLEKESERELRKTLGPLGSEIFELKSQGYGNREIGKLLGVSRKRMGAEITRVRAHARSAGKGVAA
jgi:RNA polymerase sigma factor (sigma-70 family)